MSTKEFEFLVDVIDEELMAQFWVRRFGLSIETPDSTLVRQASTSIAEEVRSRYRMDLRETAVGGLKATGMTRKGFERLCDIVDQVLAAEFTVRRFGQIDSPDPERRRAAAGLVADVVLSAYRMEPRDRPT